MAVRLMYAGGALSLISFIATLLTIGSIRDELERSAANLTEAQVDTTVTITIVAAVFAGLIAAGLWFLMGFMNNKGAKWARIVATILFAFNTLSLLSLFIGQGQTAIGIVLGLVIWLVGLGAVIFMWRSDSSAYYEAASARPA
jgi:hypothetical protein